MDRHTWQVGQDVGFAAIPAGRLSPTMQAVRDTPAGRKRNLARLFFVDTPKVPNHVALPTRCGASPE